MRAKTVDERVGDLYRKIEGKRAQVRAYSEPINEEIKDMQHQIKRLLLEDGDQQVDMTLFDQGDKYD